MKKPYFLAFFIATLLVQIPEALSLELVVIVHPSSRLQELTARQVSDLYLGRTRALASDHVAEVHEHVRDSELRKVFFQRLNGMSIRQVNAYWARLQFSGAVQPPIQLGDSGAVAEIVSKNPNAIGYIDSTFLKGNVRVVLRLKD